MTPDQAVAVQPPYTCDSSGVVCQVPPGLYSTTVQNNQTDSRGYTVTNNGTITVPLPATSVSSGNNGTVALSWSLSGVFGTNSSDKHDAPTAGGNSGNLTFINAAPVTQTGNGGSLGYGIDTIFLTTVGGDGGNYTGTDNDQGGAGAGTAGSITFTNNAAVILNGTFSVPTTSVVYARSTGGTGGGTTSRGPDSNGNPQYGSQNGTNGAAGGAVTVTNNAAITISGLTIQSALWAVGAQSRGGNAGVGNDGQSGGSAGAVSFTNNAPIAVSLTMTGTSATELYAIYAQNVGGNGTPSVNGDLGDGGAGGAVGAVGVTLNAGGTVNLGLGTQGGGSPGDGVAAAVGAFALGGNGGTGYNQGHGGFGGATNGVTVSATSANVTATGTQVAGIIARATGGVGGNGGIGQDSSSGGDGGSTGYPTNTTNAVQVSLAGSATVSTTGAGAPGIQAISQGGLGGTGTDYDKFGLSSYGGIGGGGGNSGPLQVQLSDTAAVATTGAQSPGIVAIAAGGVGGRGGNIGSSSNAPSAAGFAGNGGTGGQGAPVTVTLASGTSVSTTGAATGAPSSSTALPPGIVASSIGGPGGQGGELWAGLGGAGSDGGAGGGGYNVTVTVNSNASVSTAGDDAAGVFARSLGGEGGSAGTIGFSGFVGIAGTGGTSGNSGTVTVTNNGAITTLGDYAPGIFAQTMTGQSGAGGSSQKGIYGSGGASGSSGAVGTASVTNTSTITTSGVGSIGILAQAVGGGSGNGGSGGNFSGVGGDAAFASNGGPVNVTQSGTITTAGNYALGVLAQSIGGGGGNGGTSGGIFTAIGGAGGGGGNGAATSITTSGTIATAGAVAHGIVAQSIGGGGGNAGDATSTGVVVSVAIGGSGGAGGTAGSVTLNATGGTVTTQNTKSSGIVAQSVGGGGGTGGAGYGYSVSAGFGAAVGVGGSGGVAGGGGSVTANLSGVTVSTGGAISQITAPSNTLPVDTFGVVAQSVGGGGGMGGSAAANALTLAIPSPETGNQYSMSVTTSVGGSGGSGGGGGPVSVALTNGTKVTTQGQGGHGIKIQSISGGGGSGGDSSAMAATLSYGRIATATSTQTISADIAVAVGGSGGGADPGGTVKAEIGGQNGVASGTASVTTYGDYANAVLVQSIAGGGGNGGFGTTTTQAFGATWTGTVGVAVGGVGASGAVGGTASTILYSGSSLRTYGSGAPAIVVQSIGGGGGTSQGGSVNLGASVGCPPCGPATVQPTFTGTFNWGGTGGSGGNGGSASATIQGSVLTSGGDSTGVFVQSVGGGGGLSGSAGAEASADNPVSALIGTREFISAIAEKNIPLKFGFTVSLGGRGGAAGEGGSVGLTNAGSVTTRGDWAQGVFAQSVGGGGGKGGTSVSNTAGAIAALNFAIGGSGGAGGSGQGVTVTLNAGSTISTGQTVTDPTTGASNTFGYGAFGLLAQSIGGGGGHGADGSPGSTTLDGTTFPGMSIGGGYAGGGGSAGNGGAVSLTGTGSVTTLGDAAAAIILQSIGGGGGTGGTGSSLSDELGPITEQVNLNVGGASGSSGIGGPVTIGVLGTQTVPAVLTIATSGQNAYGILAQSIGGGGGFGFTAPNNTNVANTLGAQGSPTGNSYGQDVNVTLSAGSSITTTGGGSHAIVAQSVGGGGGIAGFPTQTMTVQRASGGGTGNGQGGQVTIDVNGAINTSGAGAFGILAQSIGGGGGLLASGNTLFVGTTGGSSANGSSGVLRITQSGGTITTSGTNAVGIFAQSSGLVTGGGSNNNFIDIAVNGAISGGAGSNGFGIWVDSGTTANVVTIGSTGSVSALSGLAINYSGVATLNVTNNGILTGDVHLNGGAGTGTVTNNGNYNGVVNSTANVVNAGVFAVGRPSAFSSGTLVGNLTQTASGVLAIDADFSGRRSDALLVQGNAVLSGRVRPAITSVLPNIALPVLTVTGSVSGGLTGADSSLFGYGITRSGNVFSITATSANFAPAAFALADSRAAAAGHLQAAWDRGGNAALAPLFALLGNTADTGGAAAYSAQLRQLSPDATFAPGARGIAGAQNFANTTLSCPEFEGTTAMLVEGRCAWMRVTGRTANQDSGNGVSRFKINTTTWQIGGQTDLGSGWLLGGSLAYENNWLSSADSLNKGNGQAGYGAVTLKYQTGPWLLASSVFGGAGQFNTSRIITLPGFGSVAKGNPDTANVGLLLRASYTVGGESFYLRPSLSLSTINVRTGGYRETGAGALNLSVDGASQTTAMLTPMLEIGGRIAIDETMTLRPFLMAGVSFLSSDQWKQTGRLISAPAGAGGFTTSVPMDQVAGRVTAGVQLYTGRLLDFRVQYEGEYGGTVTAHGGSLVMSVKF